MPSIISHPAVPLALTAALGSALVPPRLAVVACVASVVPDLDSLGFMAGVPYGDPLGHRGFTHSLAFALILGALGAACAKPLGARVPIAFAVVFFAAASHGLLDAMTTGGLGVAFFSPFSNARYFLPWRVIEVSPIGIAPFLSDRGLAVLKSESIRIWIPCGLIAGLGASIRWIAMAH